MEVDFLVVGQGLAGTVLALELMDRGKNVLVMADPRQPCASKIAAGLYNPITGHRLVKTWKADALFGLVETFYKRMETLLDAQFVHPIGIYRPFTSLDEQNDWMARSADPQYQHFVAEVRSSPHTSQLFQDPYGGIVLRNAGFIDTGIFLSSAKKYLQVRGALADELFLEDKLSVGEHSVTYEGIQATHIILAHGLGATQGELFSWLPFHGLKGEILEVATELAYKTIFNRGCFMLPVGNGRWRVGSTYNWRSPNLLATQEAKTEILDKLNHLYKGDVEVTDHLVGIRPSTKDRRPFLGNHPKHENVHIFNGLGTKGVSLSPYFAREMVDHLIDQKALSTEVDIERYYALYFERNVR